MSVLVAFNFDPLESLDELKSSGIEERQARAFISLVKKSAHASLENLATKEDLAGTDTKIDTFRSELKQDIALTEARLENKITDVKSELKQDIAEVKSELKQEIAEVKSELKQDIAEVKSELKQDIAEIKGSVNLLNKLFFGSVLLIMVDIAVTLLHHA